MRSSAFFISKQTFCDDALRSLVCECICSGSHSNPAWFSLSLWKFRGLVCSLLLPPLSDPFDPNLTIYCHRCVLVIRLFAWSVEMGRGTVFESSPKWHSSRLYVLIFRPVNTHHCRLHDLFLSIILSIFPVRSNSSRSRCKNRPWQKESLLSC